MSSIMEWESDVYLLGERGRTGDGWPEEEPTRGVKLLAAVVVVGGQYDVRDPLDLGLGELIHGHEDRRALPLLQLGRGGPRDDGCQ